MTGCVFHVQRFSLHDGPGIRSVVFLKGCPLRCIWCHNPEGLNKLPQIRFAPQKCIGCAECATVCKGTAHVFTQLGHRFDFAACGGCMRCPQVCPAQALEADGEYLSVDRVMEEVLRDRDYYGNSGGGMTLSGGEPFYQPEFALALLRRAKQEGIHCAVETCGLTAPTVLEQAAQSVDLFLFDYKATGEQAYRELTGASDRQILENLALLDRLGANIILRCPIIPGINDHEEHYRGIGRIAGRYANIQQVHVMPYHSMGVSKGLQVGVEPAFRAESMTYETAAQIRKEIEKYTQKTVQVI